MLCKTNVLVVDEFSMLDATLFRTVEGLCRRYARKGSSKHLLGGRHVILLGDPAQLPAVSNRDIFGTDLWRTFDVLLLREVKRAKDPQLQSLLEKVRIGVHNKEVERILRSSCKSEDIAWTSMLQPSLVRNTRSARNLTQCAWRCCMAIACTMKRLTRITMECYCDPLTRRD